MNRRMRLVASGLCALVAMVACLAYGRHERSEAERASTEALERYGGEVVSLVVATRTIEAGEVVSAMDVSQKDWLAPLVPDDAQFALDEVVGRQVTVPVGKGVPLTDVNFRSESDLGDVPSGHVAVSVPLTDRLGASVSMVPGTHAIAFACDDERSQAICGDVIVMSVPEAGSMSGRGSLTIAVNAADVSRVLSASTSGALRLVVPASDVTELGGPSAPANVEPAPQGGEPSKDADASDVDGQDSNEGSKPATGETGEGKGQEGV